MSRIRLAPLLAAVAVLLVALAACSSSGSPSDSGSTPTTVAVSATGGSCSVPRNVTGGPSSSVPKGSIRVLAAASLTESFNVLAKQFEQQHPGTKVAVSYGASSTLVAQVHQGAPADVLATADTDTMGLAVKAKDVDTPRTFACNRLAILVAKGNPKHIRSLADLARRDVRFVLCAAPVPCGRLGRDALRRAHVDAQPVGSEQDVKTVVAKVEHGDVDAGIVYVSDALAAKGRTSSVTIPASQNIVTSYPIAVTADSSNEALANAFIAYVTSGPGEAVLARFGFSRS